MKRYTKLFFTQMQCALAISMTYRADFLMWFTLDIGWTLGQILFFIVLYGQISELGGWHYPEMLIFLGFYRILVAFFWSLLWSSLWNVPQLVNRGDLDLWLIKPVNVQFMLSTKGIALSMLPSLLIGILLIMRGASLAGFTPNILDILSAMVIIIIAILICYAIWFISITAAFYVGRLENIIHVFPEVFSMGQFPKSAYPLLVQIVITFVIPVGLLAYVPAQIFLHRVQWWEIGLEVALAVWLLYLSHWFWNKALRNYTSASS